MANIPRIGLLLILFALVPQTAQGDFFNQFKKDLQHLGRDLGLSDEPPAEQEEAPSQNLTPSSSEPALKAVPVLNADRPSVLRAQSLLKGLGYSVGTPDGLFGPKTKAAISQFQQGSGALVTGNVTQPLIAMLEHANERQPATNTQLTENDLESAKTQDRVLGTLGGTALGAGIGGLTGGEKGALIGAGVGTIVGALAGNEVANRRESYAKEYAELDRGIADAEQENARLEGLTQRLAAEITSQEAELAKLLVNNKADSEQNIKLNAELQEIQAALEKQNSIKNDYLLTRETISADIETVKQLIRNSPDDQELLERKKALEIELSTLMASYRRLNDLEPILLSQIEKVKSAQEG